MRVLVQGKDTTVIEQLLRQEGIELVEEDAEVVVSYGGDGTLLQAEREYPGVPKLAIRRNSICKTCVDHETSHIVKALAKGTITQTKVTKLETTVRGQHYLALNEFSFHHVKPYQAIRFKVKINDEEIEQHSIGDGVIVATPFGSHAYYRSITSSTFRVGIGIAFNNTTEPINHMVVTQDDTVTIKLLRGPAYFIQDNNPKIVEIEAETEVEIRKSSEEAVLLGLDYIRCPDCGTPEAVLGETQEAA